MQLANLVLVSFLDTCDRWSGSIYLLVHFERPLIRARRKADPHFVDDANFEEVFDASGLQDQEKKDLFLLEPPRAETSQFF